jgi:hypothetical protein
MIKSKNRHDLLWSPISSTRNNNRTRHGCVLHNRITFPRLPKKAAAKKGAKEDKNISFFSAARISLQQNLIEGHKSLKQLPPEAAAAPQCNRKRKRDVLQNFSFLPRANDLFLPSHWAPSSTTIETACSFRPKDTKDTKRQRNEDDASDSTPFFRRRDHISFPFRSSRQTRDSSSLSSD